MDLVVRQHGNNIIANDTNGTQIRIAPHVDGIMVNNIGDNMFTYVDRDFDERILFTNTPKLQQSTRKDFKRIN